MLHHISVLLCYACWSDLWCILAMNTTRWVVTLAGNAYAFFDVTIRDEYSFKNKFRTVEIICILPLCVTCYCCSLVCHIPIVLHYYLLLLLLLFIFAAAIVTTFLLYYCQWTSVSPHQTQIFFIYMTCISSSSGVVV